MVDQFISHPRLVAVTLDEHDKLIEPWLREGMEDNLWSNTRCDLVQVEEEEEEEEEENDEKEDVEEHEEEDGEEYEMEEKP